MFWSSGFFSGLFVPWPAWTVGAASPEGCLGLIVLTAELARETLETNWIKLELINDQEMLLPDPIELYDCCMELKKKKFCIFAYCSDDPVLCKRLEDIGCEVVMPLISPIGSGLGVRNEHNLEIIRNYRTKQINRRISKIKPEPSKNGQKQIFT